MSIQAITKSLDIGDGKVITIETGKLAKQADGAAVVKQGNTVILATVVSDKEAGEGVDFLPLTVDYKEKYAAAGKFPGGFFKREARPSEYEILICRLIDRALRPLFPDDYHANTQVQVSLMSADDDILPDALACLAASSAIAVSDIPFNGPISEVRVARIDGKLVVNPGKAEFEKSDIDIMLAGSMNDIVMMEGEMSEISEAEMLEAIKFGHEVVKKQCQLQIDLAAEVESSSQKREYSHEVHDEELRATVKDAVYQAAYDVAKQGIANKHKRKESFEAIKAEFESRYSEEELEEKQYLIDTYFHDVEKEAVRRAILDEKIRLDGRKTDEIRPIWTEVGYLPGPHGSSIFTRGETQSLTTVTLGTKLDEQTIDGVTITGSERFILHYNFPSFSTGEARPNRGTSRREVGHGNLALRALKPIVPDSSACPYTIRIVSEILESNGSSSMATVCAGTLAMMDAGIPIAKPVSGIAMGLITDDQGKYAVLSDILGDEDHLGDMDFKVTGTKDGVTACQMDIKINGLSYEVLSEALEQARQGRLHIIGEMEKTITEPRDDYKPHAPRLIEFKIPKDLIGAVIGPGGKVIQEIQSSTNTTVTIDEDEHNGIVQIASANKQDLEAAKAKIKGLTATPEVGEVYEATVKSIMPYGAFVEFLPGKEGLLHISEISWTRLESMDGVMSVGDNLKVKLLNIDKQSGKFKLSRKVLLPSPSKAES